MTIKTLSATLEVIDANGEPVILTANVNVDIDSNATIKLEYVSLSEGGPILRPAKPRL
jgi:hypothetical protein